MKWCPPYRINYETGEIHEYDKFQKSYMPYGSKIGMTNVEFRTIEKILERYEKKYNKWRDSKQSNADTI